MRPSKINGSAFIAQLNAHHKTKSTPRKQACFRVAQYPLVYEFFGVVARLPGFSRLDLLRRDFPCSRISALRRLPSAALRAAALGRTKPANSSLVVGPSLREKQAKA